MSTSNERNPVHVYTGTGVFSVSLTVIGGGGTNVFTRQNYITVTAPAIPSFNLTASVDPLASATITGLGTYQLGDLVTLTAIPGLMAPTGYVDIVFLVDESGSMSTEHAWLATLPSLLEAALQAVNIGTSTVNRYALVGFGSTQAGHGSPANYPHKHLVGGGDWGTAAQLQTAAAGLVTVGGNEDGYFASDFALPSTANYTFRVGAAILFVLITDEDRKIVDGAITKASITADLLAANVIYTSVLDLKILDTMAQSAIGRQATNTYVKTVPAPYYTTTTLATIGPGDTPTNPDNSDVVNDYVTFTEDLGGSEWNLNFLRNGGTDATAFTSAFVAIVKDQILTAISYTFDHWTINGVDYFTNPVSFTLGGATTIDLFMT